MSKWFEDLMFTLPNYILDRICKECREMPKVNFYHCYHLHHTGFEIIGEEHITKFYVFEDNYNLYKDRTFIFAISIYNLLGHLHAIYTLTRDQMVIMLGLIEDVLGMTIEEASFNKVSYTQLPKKV